MLAKSSVNWFPVCRGGLFVILQVYADESGTHDPTGNQPSSEVAVVGGYMAWRDDWKKFCRDWQGILKQYDVPSFHAKIFNRKAKPYRSWTDDKFNSFKYALAEIAGRNIPLGGAFHIKEQHQGGSNNYPYASTIRFFSEICVRR